MSEISFLAKMLLEENLDNTIRQKLLNRIIELDGQNKSTNDWAINHDVKMWHPDLCQHEYPAAWWGIIPPSCLRCGKQASSTQVEYTVDGNSTSDFVILK